MFLPLIAHAATFESLYNNLLKYIVNPAINLLFTIAFLIFIWGVMEYMRGKDGSDARKKGKDHIIWGLVGLTIMLGIWGIIYFIASSFSFESPKDSGVNVNQYIKYQRETTN